MLIGRRTGAASGSKNQARGSGNQPTMPSRNEEGQEMEQARLSGEGPVLIAFLQGVCSANRANVTGTSTQPHTLAQVIDTLNTGAVGTKYLGGLKLLQLVRSPIKLFILGIEEMKSTNRGVHRGRTDEFSSILQGVDETRMPAAGQ